MIDQLATLIAKHASLPPNGLPTNMYLWPNDRVGKLVDIATGTKTELNDGQKTIKISHEAFVVCHIHTFCVCAVVRNQPMPPRPLFLPRDNPCAVRA